MEEDGSWRISHSIPVALLFAMGIQTASAIWFAAGLDNRLSGLAEDVIRLSAKTDDQVIVGADNDRRLVRLEVISEQLVENSAETNDLLRQLVHGAN